MHNFRPFVFQLTLMATTALSGLLAGMNPTVAVAEPADRQQHQVSGYYRMNLGEFEITALYDGLPSLTRRGSAASVSTAFRTCW